MPSMVPRILAPLAAMLLAHAGRATAEPMRYALDPVHTQVLVSASHMRYSNPVGRFHIESGELAFDADDWSDATCTVTIAIATLDMGDAAWNRKMLSSEFFDVERHPTARYVCGKVTPEGDDRLRIEGELTLLGRTLPVTLAATINRIGLSTLALKHIAGFSARGTLKRSAFGMTAWSAAVGDEVEIRLEVEGHRAR